jgi:hypothetical protein
MPTTWNIIGAHKACKKVAHSRRILVRNNEMIFLSSSISTALEHRLKVIFSHLLNMKFPSQNRLDTHSKMTDATRPQLE